MVIRMLFQHLIVIFDRRLEILLDDVESFAQNVMCQHYIIAYGDQSGLIEDLCSILGIEVI